MPIERVCRVLLVIPVYFPRALTCARTRTRVTNKISALYIKEKKRDINIQS